MATFHVSSSPSAFPHTYQTEQRQEDHPGHNPFSPAMLFPDAARLFIQMQSSSATAPGSVAAYRRRYVRKNTEKAYERHASSLSLFFSDMTLGEITWSHMRAYQDARVAGDPPFIRRRRPHEKPEPCPASRSRSTKRRAF